MPKGWQEVTLGELIDPERPITYGVVQPGEHDPNGIPLVRGGDFSFGWKPIDAYRRVSPEIERSFSRARLRSGDLVITIKGDVGTAAIVPSFLEGANISQTNARIAIDPSKAIAEIVLAFLQSHDGRRQISKVTQVGAQPGLIFRDIQSFRLLLPPLQEQAKIASILQVWDKALDKLNALRTAKVQRLEGYGAKLIHGGQAERLHLRNFLREVSTRNRGQCVDRVLSVTNSAGFVLAEDQFAHRVASADLSNYKIVQRGQYAYNPSRINVGSIARLDAWEEGVLSPMYVAFGLSGDLDSDYFSHWLRSAEARQRIALAAQGSVRETVSFGDLGSLLIPVPTTERQQTISRALNAGCEEIHLIEKEIKGISNQKSGLIQKLLTGEWRVS